MSFLRTKETCRTVKDFCVDIGISNVTYYIWKTNFDVLELSDVVRMKYLQDENVSLKRIPAIQTLEINALKTALENLLSGRQVMSDSLVDGRRFRLPNIMDNYNRESLSIDVDTSPPTRRLFRVLDGLLSIEVTWNRFL